MFRYERIAILLLAVMFAAGCATPGPKGEDADAEALGSAETESSAEAEGLSEDEMMLRDPLEDPDSALSERVIYFEFDRSDIPTEYLDLLSKHAEYLVANPDVKARLEGHADERGSREYNIGLGDRRAQAVRRILIFQGVTNDQVSTVSYGEERPVVDASNESAYAKNRRVEIIYLR